MQVPEKSDDYRIRDIVYKQKLLIDEFEKTGNSKLLPKFLALAREFQRIHERHQKRALIKPMNIINQ